MPLVPSICLWHGEDPELPSCSGRSQEGDDSGLGLREGGVKAKKAQKIWTTGPGAKNGNTNISEGCSSQGHVSPSTTADAAKTEVNSKAQLGDTSQ